MNIGKSQSGDDATGYQSYVLRDWYTKTTNQQNEKNRKITVIGKDRDQDIHLVFITSSAAQLDTAIVSMTPVVNRFIAGARKTSTHTLTERRGRA